MASREELPAEPAPPSVARRLTTTRQRRRSDYYEAGDDDDGAVDGAARPIACLRCACTGHSLALSLRLPPPTPHTMPSALSKCTKVQRI